MLETDVADTDTCCDTCDTCLSFRLDRPVVAVAVLLLAISIPLCTPVPGTCSSYICNSVSESASSAAGLKCDEPWLLWERSTRNDADENEDEAAVEAAVAVEGRPSMRVMPGSPFCPSKHRALPLIPGMKKRGSAASAGSGAAAQALASLSKPLLSDESDATMASGRSCSAQNKEFFEPAPAPKR